MYCAVCGCAFSLPDIRNPVNPDPAEDPSLDLGDPYDSRLLPREQTAWLRNFRLVGRWAEIDPIFANVSSTPGLFMSSRAEWYYRDGLPDPEIPDTTGGIKNIAVYSFSANEEFPIHEACLDIAQRACHLRQQQSQTPALDEPKTIMDFCDALRRRVWKSEWEPDVSHDVDRYYGNSGGIEWPHNYYGARQFWTDEWDTEPGWELLCADPSPMKIPGVESYLMAIARDLGLSSVASQGPTKSQLADRLKWILPEELEQWTDTDVSSVDWKKVIPVLLQKAHENGPKAGDEEERKEGKLKSTSAPLGLQNRWRIWKILQDV